MTNGPAAFEIQLPIEGMTCASCVNRIERFLNKTDGVEVATVNLATEMATIRYLPDVADRDALVGAVAAAGYEVRPEVERTVDAPPPSSRSGPAGGSCARRSAPVDTAA